MVDELHGALEHDVEDLLGERGVGSAGQLRLKQISRQF